MLAGLFFQVLVGAAEPNAALAGFAHPAVISVAALLVVAAGLRDTGASGAVAPALLGLPRSEAAAQLRLMVPVAVLSAFINNTPVVAMYLPLVRDWARRIRVSASKLLIPLSFASILGGQLTLIGSASNLIVMGLYLAHLEAAGLPLPSPAATFWGPALLGLPAAAAGIAYLVGASRALLPERLQAEEDKTDPRDYTAQMEVLRGSPVAGATVEAAGLRRLPGLFLFEIERAGAVLAAPPPETRLLAGDILGFTGDLDSVVDLQRIRGLAPALREDAGGAADPSGRDLVEAVVAAGSPLAGRTVREARFRTVYNAAIVAVRRNGAAIRAKIGDIRLEPGDTLLLETPRGFARAYRSSSHFYLVSPLEGFEPPRHHRLRAAAAVFGLLVAGLLLAPWEPVVTCMGAAVLMLVAGCARLGRALAGDSLQAVVAIAAALGMGAGLEQSGGRAGHRRVVPRGRGRPRPRAPRHGLRAHADRFGVRAGDHQERRRGADVPDREGRRGEARPAPRAVRVQPDLRLRAELPLARGLPDEHHGVRSRRLPLPRLRPRRRAAHARAGRARSAPVPPRLPIPARALSARLR